MPVGIELEAVAGGVVADWAGHGERLDRPASGGGKAGGLMSTLRRSEGNPASAVQRAFTSFSRLCGPIGGITRPEGNVPC